MEKNIVLSRYQAETLLSAQKQGLDRVACSPDQNLTQAEARLSPEGVWFSDAPPLPWNVVKKILKSKNACFAIEEGRARKITAFSDLTNRAMSLMPTENAPTMLISGTLMHRIKGTDPWKDTIEKIRAVEPVSGRVLDTATGLGYTAILAARTATRVDTIELDPAAGEILEQNPWSRELVDNPRVVRHSGPAEKIVPGLESGAFSIVIHDPPVLALAGDLYSLAFYRELYRVLARGGRLFHYVGNPGSPSGARTLAGVMKRLKEAGFRNVRPRDRAFGASAAK